MRLVTTTSVVLVAVLTLFLGCDGQRRAKSERRPPPPPTLETADRVTPVADGGAYATSYREGIWYVRGAQGVKVNGLPRDFFVSEIIPAADGGAYAISSDDGVWYLRGGAATKVQEVQALGQEIPASRSREAWLWALLQQEVTRRKAAEEEAREKE